MTRIESVNPYNLQVVESYELLTDQEAENKIEQTYIAWKNWHLTSFEQRAALMIQTASVLRNRKEGLARLMALEMGKPLKAGLTEIEKCASTCEYYANHAAGFLKDEPVETDASRSFISYQPLGVILAIMPWNFPFWQVFRFLAPALMAGNCGILKHASNVPGCALAIEDIIKESGFPKNVFQTLMIKSEAVDKVIENPKISAVTLTGSTSAGKTVARKAASLLKKSVLELGGSDAYIILEDADLELAAETCMNSRLVNSGQSCIAAKRFVVVESVAEDFLRLFKEKMSLKTWGDPLAEGTDLGPLARTDLRDELHKQVEKSILKGARCILGGKIPEGHNAFYPPTILTGVRKGMPAYDEELFGPVASIITASDEEEAVRIANDTEFGLGAAVFTRDLARGERIASRLLQAGSCFVNALVKSDARLPFGGIKHSGYGRELGVFGIREFVNIKTVYIK